jgi:SP family myo-inositol transporter-like MFS transporter 13
VFTIGAIVMGAAVDRVSLLVGRIIVGAGIGFASMSVPVYISEAAPPSLRGLLVSTNVLVITFGQFAAACVCGAFAGVKPDGWKYMLGEEQQCTYHVLWSMINVSLSRNENSNMQHVIKSILST